jgi:hypothetical protein
MHSVIRRELGWPRVLTLVAVAITSIPAFAQETGTARDTPSSPLEERSPWLFTPLASSNPKLGTSVGALGGYLYFFDQKSRPSIFAVSG